MLGEATKRKTTLVGRLFTATILTMALWAAASSGWLASVEARGPRMVGKGTFTDGVKVRYSFLLHCDSTPNYLTVYSNGNRFRLTSLDTACCTSDVGGDLIHCGTGTGTYNGDPATAEWTFEDGGGGGTDSAAIEVVSGATTVLNVSGDLSRGNNKALFEPTSCSCP